jgi:hypothetical protein
MDETNSEQVQEPPQITEQPMAVWVFGTLNIIIGCYPFISTYPVFFKLIASVLMGKTAVPKMPLFLLSCAVSVGLSIWLIVLGIGLRKMKKWSRRGSIIYSWIQIGLFTFNLSYTIVMILSGSTKLPSDSWSFWLVYIRMTPIALIYPILLLIFMQTQKVKQAFAAIGG